MFSQGLATGHVSLTLPRCHQQTKYKCSITCWMWLANRGWDLAPGWPEIRPLTVFCMWYTAAAKVPVRQEDVPVFLQDCVTDLCRCCNCANTKETEELEDNSPDTDSEDWVSLICYFLFSFVQFYISYFIFFIKIVFMVHQCCFHLWMNEWKNEQMVIGISTITAFYWYKEGGFFVTYIEILT